MKRGKEKDRPAYKVNILKGLLRRLDRRLDTCYWFFINVELTGNIS